MLLMAILAFACLSELYRMLAGWRPVPVVGFWSPSACASRLATGRSTTSSGPRLLAAARLPGDPRARPEQRRRGHDHIDAARRALDRVSRSPARCCFGRSRMASARASSSTSWSGRSSATPPPISAGACSAATRSRPRSRPKKTIEGLGCGALATIVAVVVAGLYQEAWLPHGTALLLGIADRTAGPDRRPLRVPDQARRRHQGRGLDVRRSRRRARPAGRDHLHRGGRLLHRDPHLDSRVGAAADATATGDPRFNRLDRYAGARRCRTQRRRARAGRAERPQRLGAAARAGGAVRSEDGRAGRPRRRRTRLRGMDRRQVLPVRTVWSSS